MAGAERPFNRVEAGLALLTGRATPAWAARAAKIRTVLGTVLGEAGPGIPVEPMVLAGPGTHPKTSRIGPQRPQAVAAATDAFDALVMRRWKRLEPLLAPSVSVLWPDGTLGRHATPALLAHLAERPGKPAPVQHTQVRSHSLVELKQILARGLPEALDTVLGLRDAMVVGLGIETIRGPGGRVMLVVGPEPSGWRVRSFLLPSPDDAHLASTPPDRDDEAIRVADQLVRRIVLGQAAQIQAERNALAERVWVRGEVMDVDKLAGLAAAGPHRFGSSEVVFLGSKEEPLAKLDRLAGQAAAQKFKAGAPDAYGRPFERLRPRLITTAIGTLDPASGKTAPTQEGSCLVLAIEDAATKKLRPQVAAIWL